MEWSDAGLLIRIVGRRSLRIEIPLKVERAKGTLSLDNRFSLVIPDRDVWVREVKFHPNSLVCFTNGSHSKKSGSGGAGFCLEGKGVQRSFALGTCTTVFQAEVYAILMVAHWKEDEHSAEQSIYIYSDSQAALKAVAAPRTRSVLAQECSSALQKLARHKNVTLLWAPRHIGIPGNEKADRLARIGASAPCIGPEPMLGISRRQVNLAHC
nr:unnamed protein product [Callosobruchus analis]